MKRTLTLALAILMIASCAVCFASCSQYEMKFGKDFSPLDSQMDVLMGLNAKSIDVGVMDSVMAGYYMSQDSDYSDSLMIVEDASKKLSKIKHVGALAVAAKGNFLSARHSWLDFSRADTSKESRRFPLSAFAALVAVAMSLMLIVASSILVTNGESGVNDLKKEIDMTSIELAKLRSDFEVQNDLLEIRRIAVEEYGMVSKDFLKSEQIELAAEDSVEQFEEEPREKVGFAALLSAIGIK